MTLDQLKEQETRLRSLLDANLKAQQDIYRAEFSERTGINVGSVVRLHGKEYKVNSLPTRRHSSMTGFKKLKSGEFSDNVSAIHWFDFDKLTVIKPIQCD